MVTKNGTLALAAALSLPLTILPFPSPNSSEATAASKQPSPVVETFNYVTPKGKAVTSPDLKQILKTKLPKTSPQWVPAAASTHKVKNRNGSHTSFVIKDFTTDGKNAVCAQPGLTPVKSKPLTVGGVKFDGALCAAALNVGTPQQSVTVKPGAGGSVAVRLRSTNSTFLDGVSVTYAGGVVTVSDGAKTVTRKLDAKQTKTGIQSLTAAVNGDKIVVTLNSDRKSFIETDTARVHGDYVMLGGSPIAGKLVVDEFTATPVNSAIKLQKLAVEPVTDTILKRGGTLRFTLTTTPGLKVENLTPTITGLPNNSDGKPATIKWVTPSEEQLKTGVIVGEWTPEDEYFSSDRDLSVSAYLTGTTLPSETRPRRTVQASNTLSGSVKVQSDNDADYKRVIKLVEDVDNDGSVDAGDTVKAEYVVTNSGETTILSSNLTDAVFGKMGNSDVIKPGDTATMVSDNIVVSPQAANSANIWVTPTSVKHESAAAVQPVTPPAAKPGDAPTVGSKFVAVGKTSVFTREHTPENGLTIQTFKPQLTVDSVKTVNTSRPKTGDGAVNTTVKPGEGYTTTITVKNTGTATLTNPTVPQGWTTNTALKTGNVWPVGESRSYMLKNTASTVAVEANEVVDKFTLVSKPQLCVTTQLCGKDNFDATVSTMSKVASEKFVHKLSLTSSTVYDDATRTVTATVTVKNEGNTVVNKIWVTSPTGDAATVSDKPASLLPGGSERYTFTRKATFEELSARVLKSSYTVEGSPVECNNTVNKNGACDAVTASGDASTVLSTLSPALSGSVKYRVADETAAGVAGSVDVGERVEAVYTLSNTGNLPLTGFTVEDASMSPVVGMEAFEATVTAALKQLPANDGVEVPTLPAGGSVTFSVSGEPTVDMLRGGVFGVNNVSFTAVPLFVDGDETKQLSRVSALSVKPGNTVPTTPFSGSVDVSGGAVLTVDEGVAGKVDFGDSVSLSYTVVNNTNLSITVDKVVESDRFITDGRPQYVIVDDNGAPVDGSVVLAPGGKLTVSGKYTAGDVRALVDGSISFTPVVKARVTGCTLCEPLSKDAAAAVILETVPAVKSVNLELVEQTDSTVTYRVTNDGTVVLREIVVRDTAGRSIVCEPAAELKPGETLTCDGAI